MKKIAGLFSLLLGVSSLFGQAPNSKPTNPDSVYITVDSMPKFLSGNIYSWMSQNIVYPQSAISKHIEGKVFVGFVVEKNGTVNNISLLQGVDTSLNREALRVVSIMPAWKPGLLKGEAVRVKLMLPISFKLMDYEEYMKSFKVYCDTCVQQRARFTTDTVEYLNDNKFWTPNALRYHAQGNVVLSFIIEKDGTLSTIKVESCDPDALLLQEEAIEEIHDMTRFQKWWPATIDGKPVRVRKVVTLRYNMNEVHHVHEIILH